MTPDTASNEFILDEIERIGLLQAQHRNHIGSVLADPIFSPAVEQAASIHIHSKVEKVADLPFASIRDWGVETERHTPGYVKFGFGAETNLIFSELDDFEEAHSASWSRPARPYVDHLGIDLRDHTDEVHAAWRQLNERLARSDRLVVEQPGPVLGCYAKVDDKIWSFSAEPGAQHAEPPVEIALGPLVLFDETVGCTLRPRHPLARPA